MEKQPEKVDEEAPSPMVEAKAAAKAPEAEENASVLPLETADEILIGKNVSLVVVIPMLHPMDSVFNPMFLFCAHLPGHTLWSWRPHQPPLWQQEVSRCNQ